jgi:F-type H+-transporting ATPase subunit b
MNGPSVIRHVVWKAAWKALLGAVFGLALCGAILAQENKPAAPPNSASAPEPAQQPAASKPGPEADLAAASKEAAGEEKEENLEFKQSPSVKWLASHTGMSPKAAYWVFFLLNFGILAAAVGWFMKAKLPGWSRDRGESIRRSLDEARRTSEDARGRLTQIEARLARLDVEIGELRASAEKEAVAEEQRILAAAEEDKQRIITAAEQEIAAASRLARRDLKTYAASLAVDLAEHRIKVDPQTDRALVHNFAEQFGKDKQ